MDSPAPPPADHGGSSRGAAGRDVSPVPGLVPAAAAAAHNTPGPGAPLPERSPSRSSVRHASAASTSSHRHSFAENLRNPPPSPRSLRQPSFATTQQQQAVQGLLNHPPPQRQPNPRFVGRDWQNVALGELVREEDVRWAELDTSVEDCTKTLMRGGGSNNRTGVVLLRAHPGDRVAVSSFDHSDLNAYLLVVVGLGSPGPEDRAVYDSIAARAQAREPIPVRDVLPICRKEALVTLSYADNLHRAVELFGGGVHRILVTGPGPSAEVVGVLSQLHLVEFFWNEAVNFPLIDRIYPVTLRDLRIGSQDIIAINADRPLADALTLMHGEGLTSVAVVDNGLNVVGNISTRDVELLTSVTSFPLLQASCMHFISVILSERGVEAGRDSFPVFYVNPHATLAHTVAKLVATRSHRMWLVESPSPSPSAPQTPLLAPVQTVSSGLPAVAGGGGSSSSSSSVSGAPPTTNGTSEHAHAHAHARRESVVLTPVASTSTAVPQSPMGVSGGNGGGSGSGGSGGGGSGGGSGPGVPGFTSVPAAALPGAHLSGRLTGVVSLTDILNLFAKTTGLHPSDPAEIRARRRRSSSSSLRPSLDGPRTSFDLRR